MLDQLTRPQRVVQTAPEIRVGISDLWSFKTCPASYHFRQEARKTKQVYTPAARPSEWLGEIVHSVASTPLERRKAMLLRGLERATQVLPEAELAAVHAKCLEMVAYIDALLASRDVRYHYHLERLDEATGLTLVTIADALELGRKTTVIEFKTKEHRGGIDSKAEFQTMISAWLLLRSSEIDAVIRQIFYLGSRSVHTERLTRQQVEQYFCREVRPVLRKLAKAIDSRRNLSISRTGSRCQTCRYLQECQAASQAQPQANS